MKIRKGDNVIVLTGKDRGKSGKVLQSLPKNEQVVVESINLRKKHSRPRKQGEKGQMIEKSFPLHISNVQLLCPQCFKPTRVGFKIDGENKSRMCKKCEATF